MNGHCAGLALATLGLLAGCSGGHRVPQPVAEGVSARDTGARRYNVVLGDPQALVLGPS
jgi:hypothetical protein